MDDRDKELAYLRERLTQLEGSPASEREVRPLKERLAESTSFAEVTRRPVVSPISKYGLKPMPYAEKLIIRGSSEAETAEEVQKKLTTLIKPGGEGLKVRSLLPRGKGEVLVILGDEDSKLVQSDKLAGAGLRASEIKGRRSRIILRGVDKSLD